MSELINDITTIRDRLVATVLEWERYFGFAPSVTSAVSEFDAAKLVGMSLMDYSQAMQGATPVGRGADFVVQGVRYQIKANRDSGRPGSFVTLVPKASNYDWDILIWLHYDKEYQIKEAWCFDVDDYRKRFDALKRLSPQHYRTGRQLA